MANVQKQRERLISLLKELFQLDKPDLDFGFYQIMHAKADMVLNFLEKDLLGIIRDTFHEVDTKRVEEARLAYENTRKQAEEFGVHDPELAPKVKEAKALYETLKDSGIDEGEVYDHLYRFFERYYDNGDFMSRRYYARETDSKAAAYAIPYDGREVYLHWANRDQYYIKTSEYLTNFTFDPTQSKEYKAYHGELINPQPLKVHCQIVQAKEGEHNNVKASDKTERYFLIHALEPVKLENGELIIQFEYRTDPEKTGQENTWKQKRLVDAVEVIKKALPEIDGAMPFINALMIPAPTDKEKNRTLLEKYLIQYTARNTMDYFIHKDLGGFLRRELDFYIKNEIMQLDDIELADAPRVEAYLTKIKLLRKIAHQLIDFLAQLEDFQKKLWLKKKFVVETNYCVTLDRIPEKFYSEIAVNEKQREEWVKLFNVDRLDNYSAPLAVTFLKANPYLLLDTALFSAKFKSELIGHINNIDNNIDGLLIHSENFQALQQLKNKYQYAINGIYIDPPYNTNATEIIYKNGYKHSSWASMMFNRIGISKYLLKDNGITCTTIDDYEVNNLSLIIKSIFKNSDIRPVIIEYNHRGRAKSNFSITHEYALWTIEKGLDAITKLKDNSDDIRRNLRRTGTASRRIDSPSQFYGIEVDNQSLEIVSVTEALPINTPIPQQDKLNTTVIWPIDNEGIERRWYYGRDRVYQEAKEGTVFAKRIGGEIQIHYFQPGKQKSRKSVWIGKKLDASTYGSELLNDIFGEREFHFPKSVHAVEQCIESMTNDKNALFLDYFAGSGTTGHAIINLNREDNGKRKYILVEMGNYFNTVLKPRIQKILYSKDWKGCKPVSREGVSHIFKYISLESYEDTLNNLILKENTIFEENLSKNSNFHKEYMLRYWLEFETKGSPSLLNIDQFFDPTAYTLKIKKPGADEYIEKPVDLIETFNWLIGLHVDHIDHWRYYTGKFTREKDSELPNDINTRLILNDAIKEDINGRWYFRKIEGKVCRTPGDKTNMEHVLIIWRKLTGSLEEDNLMLDEWFKQYCLSNSNKVFDVIYVNGSNNLQNLDEINAKSSVRLLEETFHQKMWDIME